MVYIITSLLPRDIGKGKSGVLLARRVPRGWDSQISRQSAHEGGKAVRLTHRPSLTSEDISLRGWVDSEVVSGAMWMTTSGIEPTTCRLVVQFLRNCANRLPVPADTYIVIHVESRRLKYYTKLRPKCRETLVEDRVAKI
jgi:hypothetical protein